MSWDDYMKSLEGYTEGKLHVGGIFGHDGSVWTSKGQLIPAQDEIMKLVGILKANKSDQDSAQGNGVFIGGKKFTYLKWDDDDNNVTFYFTGKDGDSLLNGNATLTKQTVVLCICKEESKSAIAGKSAYKLAQHLKTHDY